MLAVGLGKSIVQPFLFKSVVASTVCTDLVLVVLALELVLALGLIVKAVRS